MDEAKGYKKLEVWQLAREAAIQIHKISMSLPKFEMYEQGSQIRRSAKSVRSNIVEGYGRRRYKQEFIRFLVFSHASCEETIDHLESLFECGSLRDENVFNSLHKELDVLGAKLNLFIQVVERQHLSVRETSAEYAVSYQDTRV